MLRRCVLLAAALLGAEAVRGPRRQLGAVGRGGFAGGGGAARGARPARLHKLTAAPGLRFAALGLRGGGVGAQLVATATRLSSGPYGALGFVAIYLAVETSGMPSTALALASGTLFPPALAVALVLGSAVTSAIIAFYIGRTKLRPAVARKLASDARLRAIDRAVAAHGFRIMLLLRLIPFPPFINYVYGASSARFPDYVAATILGYLPGTLAIVLSTRVAASLGSGATKVPREYAVAAAVVGFGALAAGTAAAARSVAATLDEYRD
ncbi:snare associated Golgi protein-domain-containing protein [Pelagophyceae sp. CCMP2097]|nr:snare associated Golgi protein-domain-containing protein [Pelagophyceae sp. CCMP2097]